MPQITKLVDKRIAPNKRYQYFLSSGTNDDGDPIAQDDTFEIEASLGRCAKYLYIETASTSGGCDLTIRINSKILNVTPTRTVPDWGMPVNDLTAMTSYTRDTTMEPIAIGADSVWEIEGVIPISDIQIVTWSAGTFEILVM